MYTYWMIPRNASCNFAQQFADAEAEVAAIMEHVDAGNRITCIQAGGSIGLWALEYAKYFQEVLTFEPDLVSCRALAHNAMEAPEVVVHRQALSSWDGTGRLAHPEPNKLTCGYLASQPGGNVLVTRIDSFFSEYDPISLIHLDIEGGEFEALLGAALTLDYWSPVVVLEDHELPHAPNAGRDAAELLVTHGYGQVGAYKWQRIFRRLS